MDITGRLYHVSEEPDILLFEPRTSPQRYEQVGGDVVFAISEEMLHLYLTPRDCPRVCYMAGPDTTEADKAKYLGDADRIMALEPGWRPALRDTRLYCYELPTDPFELLDANAGYYISYESVKPVAVTAVADLQLALVHRGVGLVYVADLWQLARDISASTLRFSCIRMRNAHGSGGIL